MMPQQETPLGRPGFLFLALLLSLAFTACGGDGGGGAPAAPPPPNPLSWSDAPESATIKVGEKKEIVLSLSSAVTATYTHSASTGNVTLAGQSPRAGIYTLEITGVQAGETTVTVTAMAPGYATATATFPVTVELRPLAWTNLPAEIELEVGDQETVNLQLNASVLPELQMEPSNTNVAVSAECVPGACRMTVVALVEGESVITLTATADGYTDATGEINVTVRLRPLEWTNIPDEVEVEVSKQETVRLRLSRGVLPEFRVETSNDNVAAHGECRVGECELIIAGIYAGETRVTVIATADGYTEAMGEIEVYVTDPFQSALWRELIFDAYDCPRDDSCPRLWGGRAVEDRITSVLPSQPNFHILTTARLTFGTYRFTRSHVQTIEDAIRDAVGQTTGERFDGRITTSSTSLRDQDGWIDIIPIGNDFWEDGFGPCGAASVGARNGTIIVNVDRLDDCDLLPVAMHEVGHALGFFHVLDLGDYIMSPFLSGIPPVFHDDEQYHARLAWELGRGARYTPDPRRRSPAILTTDAFSPGGQKTLEGLTRALALKELVQCRAR